MFLFQSFWGAPALAAQAGPDCEEWNTEEYFRGATVESVRACLEAGANPMQEVWGGDSARTALGLAYQGDDTLKEARELLQAAVETAGQDCNLWNTQRYFQAATPESVTDCMEAGADPKARDSSNTTPLHRAAGYNTNPVVLQALLDAGAEVEVRDDGRRSVQQNG